MIAVVCVDDALGTMFNGRRQSRDRVLIEKLMSHVGGARIWMRTYSAELFENYAVTVDERCLLCAGDGEYCFVEGDSLAEHIEKIEKLILFRWNRAYPADRKLDVDLNADWVLECSEIFCGSSHPEIQMDVYRKANEQ